MEFLRRKYSVRRASLGGKKVTLAPDTPFRAGKEVLQIYDGFVHASCHGHKEAQRGIRCELTAWAARRYSFQRHTHTVNRGFDLFRKVESNEVQKAREK